MKKPTPRRETKTFLDYHECRDYLQKKYRYDERDFLKKWDHFEHYQKVTGDKFPVDGYPDYSGPKQTIMVWRGGKKVVGTQKQYDADFKLIHEHYRRYQAWEKENPAPEYCDFWHWVVDNHEIRNGCYVTFTEEELKELKKDGPEWVATIYGYYMEEFGKKGILEMWVEW